MFALWIWCKCLKQGCHSCLVHKTIQLKDFFPQNYNKQKCAYVPLGGPQSVVFSTQWKKVQQHWLKLGLYKVHLCSEYIVCDIWSQRVTCGHMRCGSDLLLPGSEEPESITHTVTQSSYNIFAFKSSHNSLWTLGPVK